ncbi:MAG: 3-dehydroquinate synthase [Chthoniobacterales bacterium]
MKKLSLRFPSTHAQKYQILIGATMVEELRTFISKAQQLVIITDHHIQKIYGDALREVLVQHGFNVLLLAFPAGEKSKNAKTKEHLELAMLEHGCGRDTVIVALGGGVVGDVAGFVAATYLRGIPYIQVPTTLLSMVDSSVGGKTGINTPYGKNLIGAFWQPHAVIADLNCLKTLPQRQCINGLVEVIKIFLTSDPERFYFLEEHLKELLEADISLLQEVITAAVEHKIRIVQQDEKETGERMILNFGHTMGHAIERVSGYKIMHGYAVALGILVELKISELLGICSTKEFEGIAKFFQRLKITSELIARMNPSDLLEATRQDKKRTAGQVRYILLRQIGAIERREGSVVHPVEDAIVLEALRKLTLA